MMKQILATLFIFIFNPVHAQDAATDPSQQWTLTQCMRYAVAHNTRVRIQEAQNSSQHQGYLEAIGRFLPSISANSGVGFNFGRGIDPDTNSPVNINTFSNSYNLNASLLLFDGLSNVNTLKMQRMNKLTGKHELQNRKDKIAYETMEAFIAVLYNKGLVALTNEQLQASKESLKKQQRMHELGLTSLPDVSEVIAKEAADSYNYTRQKNMLIISIIRLKEKMNFPIDTDLDITNHIAEQVIHKSEQTPYSIYSTTLSHLPEVQAVEASIKSNEYAYRASKSGFFPRIAASGNISSAFSRYMDGSDYISFKQQLQNRRGYSTGISISIPIFDGFGNTSRMKRSKVQLVIAKSNREEILRKVYSDIEQAVADMNGQVDEYAQAVKQSEAMEQAHRATVFKYQEGLATALDVTTSANRLLNAQVDELNSECKYYLKEQLVAYYRGEPYLKY